MSDPSSRLNLIERAMQLGALAREGPRPDPTAEAQQNGINAHPAPPARVSPQLLTTQSAGNPAEVIEPLQRSNRRPVRFNAAKLAESRIGSPENLHSVTYNEFRALKRKLLPMIADPQTGAMTRNVVMVTSALPGEGKTFTAMNLAMALAAEPNLDVLLIDGDVVRSSISAYFEPSDGAGLVDLLSGKPPQLDEVLHPCADLPRLHVLFSGARHEAAPELLASRGMAELCATLSTRFPQGIVLFDTPPVLAASEATAMAAHMHHCIMVVSAGRSERSQVEAALTEVSGCPSMSLIFNRSPEWERPLNDMYSHAYAYAPERG